MSWNFRGVLKCVKKKQKLRRGGGLHKPLWNGNFEQMGVEMKKTSMGEV